MITTNFNPSVLTTQRNLNFATNSLNTALERMSTGYKVNCAADDAAGMFVSSRLNANIRGLKQAQKNAQDGISLLNTAEGSLSNMTNILNRLRDLAVQGANGVYDENSLDAMQNEADSLVAQLKQIQQGTLFNGKSIFNTNATWNLTTQNAGTATISTLSGGGVSAKTPDTNSLAGINTLNSTPDAKSGSGFIEEINRLSEEEAIAQGYTVIKSAQDLIDEVFNIDNMDSIGFVDGKFILMNDIDLSGYDNWYETNKEIYENGLAFIGTFDGNGYEIKNLTMQNSGQSGFFGQTYQAEIKNLGFENVDIESGNNYSGPIASISIDTVISNCYTTGKISGSVTGGLVGGNGGIIDCCYSTVTVTGHNAGGLVAVNGWYHTRPTLPGGITVPITNCQITNSFAIGNVTGNEYVGGLIGAAGSNTSNISNVYSTGNVKGDIGVGGLIGYNTVDSSISNAYATGNVSGNSYVGGLVGGNENAFVSNSLWDKDKTGQTIGVGASTGTESNLQGLTTAEMQDTANWQGWDTSVWDFSTYPPTFKMYTPTGGGSTGGGTGGTDPSDPSNPDNPNTPGGGDVPIPGAVRLQIGSDSSSTSAIYVDTSFDLGAFDVDFSSADSCAAAIEDIDEVLSRINTKRSEFGAVINRLSSILESQTTTIQNFTSAKSTIMDADIANESADFVKNQILQQTSSALLAQSQNLHASIVLSLIG